MEPPLKPTPDFQLELLSKLQRLFSEGDFTATYKFALLIALADLAVELGHDERPPAPEDESRTRNGRKALSASMRMRGYLGQNHKHCHKVMVKQMSYPQQHWPQWRYQSY